MWRTASNLRRLCPQTPPAARRALQTDAAARSDRSNPALSSGHAENQQVQLRTTLNQDLWLKALGQVSLLVQRFPTCHPHIHTVTSQQQSPGPRAPRLGGPVHMAPWKPKSLSRTMISPDKSSSRSSLALQAMPVFLCLNGRPKLLRLPKSQKKKISRKKSSYSLKTTWLAPTKIWDSGHKAQQIPVGNLIFRGKCIALKSSGDRTYLLPARPQQDIYIWQQRSLIIKFRNTYTGLPGLFWFEIEANIEMIHLKS